ncbi:hypothetical protein HAX54_022756 [Datura stramonium]|uniref:F-box domain-containing protein n=1 Tax=Datura stramonium TaxID=4076 RepID=A0ABS8S4A7_DATST|nr:hypothetical protein [Datura stramonium]
MEYFPVEVIGNILSRLGAARDVVVASFTCRKWLEAGRNHLHTLTFNSNDWPAYDELTRSRLEVIITQTIFQTKALRCLSIILKNDVGFSAAPVIAWLMYTRDTLRHLHYNVDTPNLNILEKCGRQRLELLDLADNTIAGFGSTYQKFTCLRSLSLTRVNISTLDLSRLLSACPKVQVLNLVDLDFDTSGPEFSMRLSSNSLKDIRVEAIQLSEINLEAGSLEKLRLKDCDIGSFVLLSEGTLRILELDEISVFHLDIGKNAENLEIVEVSNFTTFRSDFHHMIVKLSKARKMSLCGVMFEDGDDEFVDVESTSACFPQLTHLSLTYELREALERGLLGYCQLENVVELELGWKVISDLFSHWVVELLERCPNLRKLVIIGAVSGVHTLEECHILANFTTFIVRYELQHQNLSNVDTSPLQKGRKLTRPPQQSSFSVIAPHLHELQHQNSSNEDISQLQKRRKSNTEKLRAVEVMNQRLEDYFDLSLLSAIRAKMNSSLKTQSRKMKVKSEFEEFVWPAAGDHDSEVFSEQSRRTDEAIVDLKNDDDSFRDGEENHACCMDPFQRLESTALMRFKR